MPSVAEPEPAVEAPIDSAPSSTEAPNNESAESAPEPAALVPPAPMESSKPINPMVPVSATPADALFAAVREVIISLLKAPMKDAEIAAALDVTPAQAKAWLQSLVDKGVIEKQQKPAGYILKQPDLFEQVTTSGLNDH